MFQYWVGAIGRWGDHVLGAWGDHHAFLEVGDWADSTAEGWVAAVVKLLCALAYLGHQKGSCGEGTGLDVTSWYHFTSNQSGVWHRQVWQKVTIITDKIANISIRALVQISLRLMRWSLVHPTSSIKPIRISSKTHVPCLKNALHLFFGIKVLYDHFGVPTHLLELIW